MGALHIQLLGDFRLRHDDTPLTGVDTPRLQSLLAYLLLHREAAQSRHHLAFLFWPDSTEAQALANLRKLLFLLRQALPEADAFLALDSQSVAWHPQSPFTLDVAEFENAIAQAQRAQASGEQVDLRAALEWAVDVYDSGGSTPAGKLLPGCYDDWILAERERLHHQFLESIDRLAGSLEQQGEYRTAISYAQRLLRHDPLHEAAYQRLMRLYGLSGDRAGVIHTYHTCTRMLQQELGVEPSLATTTLYQELLQTLDQPTNGRPGAPLSNRKPRHNLPAQLSSFIGREAEMAEIHMLLSRSRLVTMTGVGGIGKTRLAVQGAAELLGFFPDGVWLVELAAISDPAFVPNTVASLLGLPEEPGVPQLSTLCNYLRTKCLLLIMDNCEHLIEECAALAETLLRHCPDVKIIAASRQALGVTGEITFQVPTLQVPDSQQPLSSETLVARFDAVRLFTERALAVRPGFMVTRENA
ncbi:MAG: hypothetical protein HY326_10130, partial [Chloroflexi bacterium]|nr:hypothetical protein [Chloroflexota bacterium]